jgi:hypothetical protein
MDNKKGKWFLIFVESRPLCGKTRSYRLFSCSSNCKANPVVPGNYIRSPAKVLYIFISSS